MIAAGLALRATAVVGLAAASCALLTGSGAAVTAPQDLSDPHAVALLERAAAASRSVAYSGTQSVTQWSAGSPASLIVHVVHVPGVGLLARPARTADGRGRGRGALLDASEQRTAGLSVTGDQVALLRENYRLAVEPPAQVDGRPADVVSAYRASGVAAARFWLDHATGLMLRRELLDGRGRLALASVFLDVSVLRAAPQLPVGAVDAIRPASGRPLHTADLGRLARTGFRAPVVLPTGYRLVDARRLTASSGEVLHLTYCDGLTTLSVFEQHGRLDRSRMPGWRPVTLAGAHVIRAPGLPQRVAWSSDGTVYTLLTDSPDDALADVVGAWPHGSSDGGLLHRLQRGLARIGSWFDPFH